jgi:hypothetical protein
VRLLLIVIVSRIKEANETGPEHLFSTEFPKKIGGKNEKDPFFLPMPVPGPFKVVRPSTVFVQIIPASKWTGVSLKVSGGIDKRQDLVRKRYINCSRLTPIGDTLIDC